MGFFHTCFIQCNLAAFLIASSTWVNLLCTLLDWHFSHQKVGNILVIISVVNHTPLKVNDKCCTEIQKYSLIPSCLWTNNPILFQDPLKLFRRLLGHCRLDGEFGYSICCSNKINWFWWMFCSNKINRWDECSSRWQGFKTLN